MMIMRSVVTTQRGFVMVTSLALLLMLGILGVSTVMKSSDDAEVTANQLRDLNALYAAEAGADKAFALFSQSVEATGLPPNPLPSDSFDLELYGVTYRVDKTGTPTTRTITNGAYQGLIALVVDYDIWGHSQSPNTGVQNSVKIRMERALIPIFQFAIFYDDVLEWHPGPVMQLSGRVHSNGDLYLGSHNGLSIDSRVTAAGALRHGRHPDAGQSVGSGFVSFKDKAGNYQNMESGGTWLDHDDPDWFEGSMERWQGMVRDEEHGVQQLAMPLEASTDAINIIKDQSGGNTDSYEHKAGLKIIDGQAYYKVSASTWVDVTANMVAEGSLTSSVFRDDREGTDVDATTIDISKLNTSAYWPSNGIVYTKDTQTGGDLKATKLMNGSSLADGLTIVSENPLYTEGNYNSVNKKPAALMADAYTILSSNWSDGNSFTGNVDDRNASNTVVNASFVTGYVPSNGGNYSGGVENFPRFLEKWSGNTLTWSGSMVQMWLSEQANSPWSYGSYYEAPNRDWHFDSDLLDPDNLPPGTPMVATVIKRGWANTGGPMADAP
ncbi:MAG: hypothetical protein GF341_01930 [candidate division Zixibacteria bacterium]|nr:hypothetical protein [candidate division Zixibacteria bacterium]